MQRLDFENFLEQSEKKLASAVWERVADCLKGAREYARQQKCEMDELAEECDDLRQAEQRLRKENDWLRKEVARLASENARLTAEPVVYMCDEIRVDRAEFVGASFGSMYDVHGNQVVQAG